MLSPDAVGAVFAEIPFEATPRRTMAYAAGIGAARAAYLADDRPGGPVAPPGFCVSPEWRLLTDERYFAALGLTPADVWRGVHVAQDTRFHRPLRPGTALTVSGRLDGMRPTRAGALVESTITIRETGGAPVTETRWTAIYRGTGCEPAGETAPPQPGPEVRGGGGGTAEIGVPAWLPHAYTECAGIWNPIHTERAAAARLGLPDILLHGSATWALAGEALIDACGEGDPTRLRRLACRFTAPVWPGSRLSLRFRAADAGRSVAFDCRSEDGRTVAAGGIAAFGPAGRASATSGGQRSSAA